MKWKQTLSPNQNAARYQGPLFLLQALNCSRSLWFPNTSGPVFECTWDMLPFCVLSGTVTQILTWVYRGSPGSDLDLI